MEGVSGREGTERDLIGNYGPTGRSCVCCYYDTAIKDAADDGCTSAGSFGEGNTSRVESEVAVVVGEVKARHGGGGRSARGFCVSALLAMTSVQYSLSDFSRIGSLK